MAPLALSPKPMTQLEMWMALLRKSVIPFEHYTRPGNRWPDHLVIRASTKDGSVVEGTGAASIRFNPDGTFDNIEIEG